MNAVLDQLKSELECPVCYTIFPNRKIYQCKMGHSVCSPCLALLKSCPQCKCEYKGRPTRNLIAEHVISNLPLVFDCRNCSFKGKAEGIQKHAQVCLARTVTCPAKAGCKVQFNELTGHVRNHTDLVKWEDKIVEDSIQVLELKWNSSANVLHGSKNQLGFSYDNENFLLHAEDDFDCSCWFWVTCLGDKDTVNKYATVISLKIGEYRITGPGKMYSVDDNHSRSFPESGMMIVCSRMFQSVSGILDKLNEEEDEEEENEDTTVPFQVSVTINKKGVKREHES